MNKIGLSFKIEMFNGSKIFVFLLFLSLFLTQTIHSQTLTSISANATGSNNAANYATLSGSELIFADLPQQAKVLVVATFNTDGTSGAISSYQLISNLSANDTSSAVLFKHNAKKEVGSLVHIFTVASGGNASFSFQQNISSGTVNTTVVIHAVVLSDGSSELKTAFASISTPITMSSSYNAVVEASISNAYSGGFYLAAALSNYKNSGGTNTVSGDYILQFKLDNGSWTDINYAVRRSAANSDRRLISLVGLVPNSAVAGNYSFRVAHKVSGANQLVTEKCEIIAVNLGTPSNGYFSSFSMSKNIATTSSTSLIAYLNNSFTVSGNTDFFSHTQSGVQANGIAENASYDVNIAGTPAFDGPDYAEYIASSASYGSCAMSAISNGLLSGNTYSVSMRHASVASRTLSTSSSNFCGFALTRGVNLLFPVSVSATEGLAESDYPSLKAAFDEINNGIFKGNISIAINKDLVETASAVLNASGSGSANYTSIVIYPTATVSVSASVAAALIDLNGADNITIDGRVNRAGSAIGLTIKNTSTNVSARTLLFRNSAENNIISYVNLSGSAASANTGIVHFSTSSAGNGNKNISIENSAIYSDAAGRAYNAIYSSGSSGRRNSLISIKNNQISNFFSPNASSNGINILASSENWTIEGNSFFDSQGIIPGGAFSYQVIRVYTNDVNNYTIKNNYIGGSAALCAGTPMIVNAAGQVHEFKAVYFRCSESAYSLISGNVIKNISLTTSSTSPFDAFFILTGLIDIVSNQIGDTAANNSIIVTAASGANFATTHGIVHFANSNVNILQNNIGSIQLVGAENYAHGFEGIYKRLNTSGIVRIEDNTIGHLSRADNIIISTTGASATESQRLFGIYFQGTGSSIIRNNLVANLTNNYAGSNSGSLIRGIYANAGNNNIEFNTVGNLKTASGQITGATNASAIGIAISNTASASIQSIRGNKVYNIQNVHATARVDVYGVFFSGPYDVFSAVERNYVYDLSISSSDKASSLDGIVLYNGDVNLNNNIVSLGKNNLAKHFIYGVWDNASAGSDLNCLHNTIVIEAGDQGTNTISSNFAFWNHSNSGTPRVIRNNLFVNKRSNGITGKNYGIRLASTVNLTINNNNYFVPSGVLGYLTIDRVNLTAWKTATAQEANSFSVDPLFIGGSENLIFYPSAQQIGAVGLGIGIDYTGLSRQSPPKVGALEQNEGTWIGTTNTDFNTASNWFGGAIPSNGSIIRFSDGAVNNCVLHANRTVGAIINNSTRTFDVNGKTLVVTGNLIIGGGSSGKIDARTAESHISYEGTSKQLISASHFVDQTIQKMTINNSYGADISGDLIVSDALTLSNGNLSIGANNLTINDTLITTASGTLLGGETSNLIVGGAGASLTIPEITLNTLTLNRSNGLLLGGDLTLLNSLILSAGTLDVNGKQITINGNTLTRTSGNIDASDTNSKLLFANTTNIAMPNSLFSAALYNLELAGAGLTFNDNITISNQLYLNAANPSAIKGLLDMDGTSVLTMDTSATTLGEGDVTGRVLRTTIVNDVEYTFGSPYTHITFTGDVSAVMPSSLLFIIEIGSTHQIKSNTIKRYYQIIRSGADGSSARFNLSLRYLDSELNGNIESNLVFWDHHVKYSAVSPHEHGQSDQNTTANYISLASHGIGYLVKNEWAAEQESWNYSVENANYSKIWLVSGRESAYGPNVFVWLGPDPGGSNEWFTATNWLGSVAPTNAGNDTIIVNSNHIYKPSFPIGTTNINSLIIENGGVLDNVNATTTLNAKYIRIYEGGTFNAGSASILLSGGLNINNGTVAFRNNGTFNAGTSTVTFNRTTSAFSGTADFYNLDLVHDSVSLTLIENAVFGVKNNFTKTANSSFYTHTNPGTTVRYVKAGDQNIITPTDGYNHLQISNSGVKNLPSPLTIYGNLTVSGSVSTSPAGVVEVQGNFNMDSTTTFTTGAYSHVFKGNLAKAASATFAASASTVTFSGSTQQVVSGKFNFNNLTLNNGVGALAIDSLTVNGTITLTNGSLAMDTSSHLFLNGGIARSNGSIAFDPTASLSFNGTAAITLPINTFSPTPVVKNLSINNAAGVVLSQDMEVNNLLTLTAGTLNIAAKNLTLSGTAPARTNGSIDADNGTITFNNSGAFNLPASIFSAATIKNITFNNTGGVTAPENYTLTGILHLNAANPSAIKGLLDMDSNILNMGATATTIGTGDVTGIVKRSTFVADVDYSFGSRYTTVRFAAGGTLPSEMKVKIAIGTAPAWKDTAVKRVYDYIKTGGENCFATVSSSYLNSELNNNSENLLVHFTNGTGGQLPAGVTEWGKYNSDTVNNFVSITNIPIASFPTEFGKLENCLAKSAAVTYTWTGATDSDFNTSANWLPVGSPNNTSIVIIPDSSTLTNLPIVGANAAVNQLIVNEGGSLKINAGNTFTIDSTLNLTSILGGVLVNAGTLIINKTTLQIEPTAKLISNGSITSTRGVNALLLKSNALSSATFIHNTVGLEATVQRYVSGRKWVMVASPVSGMSIQDFFNANTLSKTTVSGAARFAFRDYIEATGWSELYPQSNNSGNLDLGKGYLLRSTQPVSDVITFKGTLQSQNFSVPLVVRAAYGWNGVGNPYTAPLDMNSVNGFIDINMAKLEDNFAALYVYNPDKTPVAGYEVFNKTPLGDYSGYLSSAQGFIVKVRPAINNLNFNANMRNAGENPVFFKNAADYPWYRMKLQLSSGTSVASTSIALNETMTKSLDVAYDAGRYAPEDFMIYSKMPSSTNSTNLAIQAIPTPYYDSIQIPLGVYSKSGGEINISLSQLEIRSNTEVLLKDSKFDTMVNMQYDSYTTTISGSDNQIGRFFLIINDLRKKVKISYSEPAGALLKAIINDSETIQPGYMAIPGAKLILTAECDLGLKVDQWIVNGKIYASEVNKIEIDAVSADISIEVLLKSIGTAVANYAEQKIMIRSSLGRVIVRGDINAGDELIINDVSGKIMTHERMHSNSVYVSNVILNRGLYIVCVRNIKGQIIQKILVD